MKVPNDEEIANHIVPESCAAYREVRREALTTTATQPFIRSDWVKPGTHLGLMGAFTPQMAEAEPQLLPKVRLFVDSREAVLQKGGEVLQALRAGLIRDTDVRAELAELLTPSFNVVGRMSDQDITVFKSVGFASLDLIAAEYVLRDTLHHHPQRDTFGHLV